ncbi:hypothetical protein PsorP6_015080 [Peronosclerospora sorghi]|uniref:Uncharacterized protein n=1 Tax=Peronosclerospora sorghi TaxID=230839 RepID=A0ACC0VUJ3_9STRA|nr:hypothetical protein PsorP6_015080 [Peronosclerospora sorghi]
MRIHHRPVKSPGYESPFSPLQLAVEDEAQLEAVARLFVQNTVMQYEKFIEQDRRKIDSDHWKCIKHDRDLRVYLQRRQKDVERRMRRRSRLGTFGTRRSNATELSSTETFSASFGSRSSSGSLGRKTDSFSSNCSTTNPLETRPTSLHHESGLGGAGRSTLLGVELPILQLVGSVPGSLDDAMYGALGATSDSMRVKSAYERDDTINGAVLATISAPTTADPFRSLTIKWVERQGPTIDHPRYHPLHYPVTLPGASTREDLVFLEATGTTTLATGERIGYQLRHSVHFPQTCVRPNVRRGNMSTCTLFHDGEAISTNAREGPARGSVEVFARACLSGGNAAIRSTTAAMAATGMVVLCGRMKKLAWMLAQRQPPPTQASGGYASRQSSLPMLPRSFPQRKTRRGSVTVTVSAAAAASPSTTDSLLCVTCKKRGPWYSTHSKKKKKPATTCQLCWRFVCSSCRVKKTVMKCITDARRDDHLMTNVVQRDVTLCNVCMHQSMVATSARDVAREELEADPKRWHFPSPDCVSEASLLPHVPAHASGFGAGRGGTSPLRSIPFVSLPADLAVNDVVGQCAC